MSLPASSFTFLALCVIGVTLPAIRDVTFISAVLRVPRDGSPATILGNTGSYYDQITAMGTDDKSAYAATTVLAMEQVGTLVRFGPAPELVWTRPYAILRSPLRIEADAVYAPMGRDIERIPLCSLPQSLGEPVVSFSPMVAVAYDDQHAYWSDGQAAIFRIAR